MKIIEWCTNHPIIYLSFCFIKAVVLFSVLDYFLSDLMFGCAVVLIIALLTVRGVIVWVHMGVTHDKIIEQCKQKRKKLK